VSTTQFTLSTGADLAAIRERKPLVHQITNYVVMNETANATLALGALPVMAHAREEVEEMAALAAALVINIGTLSPSWVEAMLAAGRAANGAGVPIVAKIEKHEAVANIDQIIAASDALMVARGDLGVEISLERVPLVQKAIIRKCNALGKPVITATQMLVRMVDNPRPTRAEATDVANAVLDGTDAVMLSEESAVGKYPAEAVMMMDRIVVAAESELDAAKFETQAHIATTSDAISRSSYFIAKEVDAAAIITPTWSGSTACLVSRFRPKQPIIATTPNESALDFLALSWGVIPLQIPPSDTIDEMIRFSIKAAQEAGCLEPGQHVVITGGAPLHRSGNTNFIKVERVE